MCGLRGGKRKHYPLHRKFFLSELDAYGEGLAQQAYNLIKHGGFSFRDILMLTCIERNEFMKLLIDENQREKEELSSLNK